MLKTLVQVHVHRLCCVRVENFFERCEFARVLLDHAPLLDALNESVNLAEALSATRDLQHEVCSIVVHDTSLHTRLAVL